MSMEKIKDLKDKFSEELCHEGKYSNWLEINDAKELKDKIESKFQGVEVDVDLEMLTIKTVDGRMLKIHRWKKIPYAPDGQRVVSYHSIEDEIERFIKEE